MINCGVSCSFVYVQSKFIDIRRPHNVYCGNVFNLYICSTNDIGKGCLRVNNLR